MTNDEIIIRISNEILHQTDIAGIRRCVKMAIAVGYEKGMAYDKRNKPIMAISATGVIRHFDSLHDAARITGIDRRFISRTLHNKNTRTAKGYTFIYT